MRWSNYKKTMSFRKTDFGKEIAKHEKDIEELRVGLETIAERLYKLIEDMEKEKEDE